MSWQKMLLVFVLMLAICGIVGGQKKADVVGRYGRGVEKAWTLPGSETEVTISSISEFKVLSTRKVTDAQTKISTVWAKLKLLDGRVAWLEEEQLLELAEFAQEGTSEIREYDDECAASPSEAEADISWSGVQQYIRFRGMQLDADDSIELYFDGELVEFDIKVLDENTISVPKLWITRRLLSDTSWDEIGAWILIGLCDEIVADRLAPLR